MVEDAEPLTGTDEVGLAGTEDEAAEEPDAFEVPTEAEPEAGGEDVATTVLEVGAAEAEEGGGEEDGDEAGVDGAALELPLLLGTGTTTPPCSFPPDCVVVPAALDL